MDNYEISLEYKDRIKKFDKFILSKKGNQINDDLLSVYIIENQLLKHECKKCKQEPIWEKKPLQMILDRINNIITDNRINNLRFLCPNCFSQVKKRKILFSRLVKDKQRECIDCKKRIKASYTKQNEIKCKKVRCKDCLAKRIFTNEVFKTI